MVYFGTDGIRGVFGEGITEDTAYRAGRALAHLFGGRAIVGRDTRLSGPSLESALAKGITDGGADVILSGVIPTPAVSYLTRTSDASFGVMLSASHNPPEYNGIKVFDGDGNKLSTSVEAAVEYYMDYPEKIKGKGKIVYGGSDGYLDYISSVAGSLRNMRVLIDHGCGSGGEIAKAAFERAGATVGMMCAGQGGGECINCKCGALYPEKMEKEVLRGGYDIGFSFDGDADRAVCCCGRVLHGDEVLYNLSDTVRLEAGVVVGTVLTNTALAHALEKEGKRLVRTAVGDKNISELMRAYGYCLGGEPSGHYIISPYEVTGDGLLTALFMAGQMSARNIKYLNLLPQKSVSMPASPTIMSDIKLKTAIKEVGGDVRTVVRMSGTEPKIRIMVESENEQLVSAAMEKLVCAVRGSSK